MRKHSSHATRSITTREPLRFSRLLAVLALLLSQSPLIWGADTASSRIIVKWKSDNSHSRTQVMDSTRSEFRQATGLGLTPRRTLSERLDVVEVERPLSAPEFARALAELRAQANVEYAVADERRHIASLPNDSLITATSGRSGQWYLLNTEAASINAYAAWDYSQGGSSISNGVIVAVLDTGVRFDHPDLAAKLLPGYDFVDCDQTSCSGTGTHTFLTANDGDGWDTDASDPGDWLSTADQQNSIFAACDTGSSSWHGTRVAGIVGAATNNGLGIASAGWNARILPVRVLGKCGGYDSDIIAGMRWAAGLPVSGVPVNPNPAKVINLSLGSSGSCSQAYADAIATVTAAGVSVVASAGNDSAIINTPANCSGVVSVVGVRNAGTKVGFSSLGTATLAAPAGNCGTSSTCLYSIDTTTNLGTYNAGLSCPTTSNPTAKCYTTPGVNDYTDQTNYNLGTSFSAPIVSGTIALMLGANSNLTPAQITSTLRSSATAFPSTATNACQIPTSSTSVTINESECNCTTSTCGAGIVNAYQAVLAVSSSASSSSAASSAASATASETTSAATNVATDNGGGGGGTSNWNSLMLLSLLLLSRRFIPGIKHH